MLVVNFFGDVSFVERRTYFEEGLSLLMNPPFIVANCLGAMNLLSLYEGEASFNYLTTILVYYLKEVLSYLIAS